VDKNIASVISMLHHRLQVWLPNFVKAEEWRGINTAVGHALRENANRNENLVKAQARIAELERGEFICKRCGLRKDSDHPKGDF